MADDTTKTSAAAAPANNEKKEDGIKAILLAKFWKKPIEGTNPVQYKRFRAGDEVTVPEQVFHSVNSFKPTFRKVED